MVTKFKLFESYYEIESICNRYGIQNWELDPETGLVDVWGDVDFYGRFLKKLPLKFGVVTGNFNCSSNQLFSLDGCPQRVDGNFYCYDNQLASLKGAPQSVGENFDCYRNRLVNLKGSPQSVVGSFICESNLLTTLEGSPNSVGGGFDCSNNRLTSLEGSPYSVGRSFHCVNNRIKDFKVPEYSLNEERDFECRENPIYEVYRLFNTPKCIDLLNEYEVIGGDIISRVRLEEVFVELGIVVPNLDFHASKNWKLV